ncbi:hypothetical protein QVD17_08832 [Tagetes erecta]|uniref:Uncharacterized protein n=1 Tax=Tagetes erecta TaxID=13708 RepID=A0AAD8P4Q1_TARER|nr:hypothetical protein QVD17_08832 [Tagetes erecta]
MSLPPLVPNFRDLAYRDLVPVPDRATIHVTMGSLTSSSFWNHFGATTGEMDFKSLLEIEELQDKELEEAKEHRRKCEIEERNALKAYRKAQRALAEANTRCSYLYHKRNLFSANVQPHVED